MNTQTNRVNSVDAKPSSSARKGLSFTAEQLQKLHWIDGLSEKQIGAMYGVSCAAINWWCKKLGVSGRRKVKQLLFEPSPALSYILGCILGDGCVYLRKDRRYTVRFSVCDRVLAEEFAKAARLVGFGCNKITRCKPSEEYHRALWLVCLYSDDFGVWYEKLGMKGRLETGLKFPANFVRGFYESEGTIVRHRERVELSITDTHHEGLLINAIKDVLPNGIEAKTYRFAPREAGLQARHVLAIYRQLDVARFLAWVMPCIKVVPRPEEATQANTEPILGRDAEAGVENTKAIQNGTQVGTHAATHVSQPPARSKPRRCIPTLQETARGQQKCSAPRTVTFS